MPRGARDVSDVTAGAQLVLNRSERIYWALEGPMGSMVQVSGIRFDGPVAPDAVRSALRRVIRAYPRLRAVIEPTLFSYVLRVLADEDIEPLMDESFAVAKGVTADLPSLEAYTKQLLNEPFALERGLPVRARLVEDAHSPVLFVVFHHVVCDGRSLIGALAGLVRLLNGMPIEDTALDPPSMIPALVPRGFFAKLASLFRSFGIARAEARRMRAHSIVKLGGKRHARFSGYDVRLRRLPVAVADLTRAAEKLGCTVTALVAGALAQAFGEGTKRDGKNAIAIRLSVDLRKYFEKGKRPVFGNYVATMNVLTTELTASPAAVDIDRQMREGLERFDKKLMSYPFLMGELMMRVGRKLVARAIAKQKRNDTLNPMTCLYSSLGGVDALTPKGAKLRVVEFIGTAPNIGPFLISSHTEDTMTVAFSYLRDEATDEEVYAILERLETALTAIGRADTPLEGPVFETRIAS